LKGLSRAAWLAPLLAGALVFPGMAEGQAAKKSAGSGEIASAEPVWRQWQAGLQEASRTGRPILVDVYTDWCGWCRRMDRDTYAQAPIRDYLGGHYVTVKLNPEQSSELRAVANRFRVSGYPTTIFLRSNGDHLLTVPGYIPDKDFLPVLRYVAEGHMERGVEFETFRKQLDGH